MRSKFKFPNFDPEPPNPRNLIASNKLIGLQIGGEPLVADYSPIFQFHEQPPTVWMKFSDWWNETIFVAGAAKVGTDPSMVPLKSEDQVPFEKRERFTRYKFVRLVRDTVGAHTDTEIPIVLDDLNQSIGFGAHAQVQLPDGTVAGTHDGSVKVRTTPMQGMIRKIAEELMVATRPDLSSKKIDTG